MEKQNENRRVRMTKHLMKDALLELLDRTDLTGISVTAVCEAADVNRSTFYHYYTCPADLLREIEQDALDRIPVPPPVLDQRGEEQLLRATTAFFDYVKENERIFRILFSESVNSGFSSRLVDLLCAQYIPGVESAGGPISSFVQRYIANGTVGMMREWVVSGFPIRSLEIAKLMYFLSRKITG